MAPDWSPQLRGHLRNAAIQYLSQYFGVFYKWGGDDPSGWDCSGLVIEGLTAVGILPHGFDDTAQGLYLRFKNYKLSEDEKPYMGCLVFQFRDGKAIHVEMMIDNYHTIGSSGGGSKTNTREDAIKHNAFVKMRPYDYRGMNIKIVDPFKVVE